MHQPALEGRIAGDVARQTVAAGVKTGGHFQRAPFFLVHERLNGEEAIQHLAAIAVYVAGRRADLGVAIAVQRLLDEIDEAGLALQSGQERNRFAPRGLRRLLSGDWRSLDRGMRFRLGNCQ